MLRSVKNKSFIEATPFFGKLHASTRDLLELLPREVTCVEYDAGKLRFFFQEELMDIPGFLRDLFPHCQLTLLSHENR
jgi:hypothetical protein